MLNKNAKLVLKNNLSNNSYLLLTNLFFWSTHTQNYGLWSEDKRWIYNSLDQWAKLLKISRSSVKRAIKELKAQGLILTQKFKQACVRAAYYAIDFFKLHSFLKDHSIKSEKVLAFKDQFDWNFESEKNNFRSSPKFKNCISSEVENTLSEATVFEKFEPVREPVREPETNTVPATQISAENQIFESPHIHIANNKSNKSIKSGIQKDDDLKNTIEKPAEEKNSTVQDMMKIFSKEFPNHRITLTKRLCRYLVAVFKLKFKSSLKEWKKYLQLFKTSKFLTSEKFKLNFFWVINFNTVDRLNRGELGVKPGDVPLDLEEIQQNATAQINSLQETEACKQFRRNLAQRITPVKYSAWFKDVYLVEENGKIIIKSESSYVKEYIQNNFSGYWDDNVLVDD